LFGEERKAKIMDLIQKEARVSVIELSKLFQVSESTVRRDLKELEDAKLLTRTHGGAVSLEHVNFEPTFGEKEEKFQKEKIAIAKKAMEWIKEGDTILFDSGTTIYHLVKELNAFQQLTVVVNSLIFAQELQNNKEIEVVSIGGSLRKETLAFVGPLAEQSLDGIRVDKAFIATNGIDQKNGLTTPNLIEAATKRKMIQSAKQVILLADHSKIGKTTFGKFADLSDIDLFITDQEAPKAFIQELIEQGIDVYTV